MDSLVFAQLLIYEFLRSWSVVELVFSDPELLKSTVWSSTLTDCANEVGSLCIPNGSDIEKGAHFIFFPGPGSLHDLDHIVREMASVGVL